MEKLKKIIQKYREILLYLIFGGLTTLVSWLSYALFVLPGLPPTAAKALSWVFAVAFAFVTNKFYVFQSRDKTAKRVLREAAEFFGSRAFTGVLSVALLPLLMYLGLNQSILGIEGMLANIVCSLVEIILNYVFSKLLVFRKKS